MRKKFKILISALVFCILSSIILGIYFIVSTAKVKKVQEALLISDDPKLLYDKTGEYFNIHYECDLNCEGLRQSWSRAIKVLESNILFEKPIYIKTKYYNFTVNKQLVGHTSLFFKDLEINNSVTSYPLALARQMEFIVDKSGPDFIVEINSSHKYNHQDEDIKDDEYSLTNLLIHEAIHGLGFVFLTIQIYRYTEIVLVPYSDCIITSCEKIHPKFKKTIFSNFLYNKIEGKHMNEYVDELNGFFNEHKNFSSVPDFVFKFFQSNYLEKGKKFSDSITINSTDTFSFRYLENGLYHEIPLSPVFGFHLNSGYVKTKDFLMISSLYMGDHLKLIKKLTGNWDQDPMGPETLLILSKLGYKLKSDPSLIINSNF